MLWSQSLIPTSKETPSDAEVASHILMLRAGMIKKLASGTYSYLPLGFRSLSKVIEIIRKYMNQAGAQEILMPAIQPAELWKESKRYKELDMIVFKDRHEKENVLGPTHEEVITDIVRKSITSYKQLPVMLYQIQTKFRDEPRPRFGVIRSREFIMKDAYSFDKDQKGLDENYKKMFEAYKKIFKECGLETLAVEADPGMMGGDVSHEFMVPCETGEDTILICKKCNYAVNSQKEFCPHCNKKLEKVHAIEVGHTFKLGTRYTKILNAVFLDKDGVSKPIIMGCYGIGVNRILASAIEQSHDKDGIIWPKNIAPYEILIIPLNIGHKKSFEAANDIYKKLLKSGADVLLDDRDLRGGVKFKDADLIGIPLKIIIGEKNIEDGFVEIQERASAKTTKVKIEDALKRLWK